LINASKNARLKRMITASFYSELLLENLLCKNPANKYADDTKTYDYFIQATCRNVKQGHVDSVSVVGQILLSLRCTRHIYDLHW